MGPMYIDTLCIYIYIYIYIYIERERERFVDVYIYSDIQRERYRDMHTYIVLCWLVGRWVLWYINLRFFNVISFLYVYVKFDL